MPYKHQTAYQRRKVKQLHNLRGAMELMMQDEERGSNKYPVIMWLNMADREADLIREMEG